MVLISVDFPHPFGPRMAACSPARMRRVMSWRTVLPPRITVMLRKSRSAGGMIAASILNHDKTSLLCGSFHVQFAAFRATRFEFGNGYRQPEHKSATRHGRIRCSGDNRLERDSG